jgi:hypothetical protein
MLNVIKGFVLFFRIIHNPHDQFWICIQKILIVYSRIIGVVYAGFATGAVVGLVWTQWTVQWLIN